MHGGAPGSGAPTGNRNALKHGYYTAEAITQRRELAAHLRRSQVFIGAKGIMTGDC
jgi:glucans biosynthesis protein